MKTFLIGVITLTAVSSAFACNELDKDKRSHKTTWTTLYQLGQLNKNFKDSGRIPVNSLRTLSISNNEGKLILADQIHHVLTEGRGAKSLSGSNPALIALEESSLNDETVCDLANRLNQNYQFHGE
jgi:hypothetical protein